MSGLSPRSALKLCDAYADMSRDAQRWATRFLDYEPRRSFRSEALHVYDLLTAAEQHAVTLFIEIAASENVRGAEDWMSTLHEHNAAHPNPNRRATWEAV